MSADSAIITDQHLGVRNDSGVFLHYFEDFYLNVFFPYLEDHGIKTLFLLGDTFDRRKYVNFNTAKRFREFFINECIARGIRLIVIIGNHDTSYKNTNTVNSMEVLYGHDGSMEIHSEPYELDLDGTKILLMPWINAENYDHCMEMMEKTDAGILLGHLEIEGFEMQKGVTINHGLDRGMFKKFDTVLSGHFHHRHTQANITYLGCPYELTWHDYGDPKGFHTFNASNRVLEFVENPVKMFYKIRYDGTGKTVEDISSVDLSMYKDKYIKVIVEEKSDPMLFELFIDRLYDANPFNVDIIDEYTFTVEEGEEAENLEEAEDTWHTITRYVNRVETDVDKDSLEGFFARTYAEAQKMMESGGV
jgi:DNA repair exonuclease SbcCD nuclease subunit